MVAGCGTASRLERADPQTIRLGWREADAGLVYTVRRIEVTTDGWRVEASVTNRRPRALDVLGLHRPGKVRFGLIVSTRRRLPPARQLHDVHTPFFAARTTPPVPATLRPGQSWSGSFAGPGRPPRGAYLRVTFGRFVPPSRPDAAFALVTRHVVRLAR